MKNSRISTRLKNLMVQYIGKTYATRLWTVKVVELMGDTGYFVTEINDGTKTWKSNASYGEIRNCVKDGSYREMC
jgi:hypothetical protein